MIKAVFTISQATQYLSAIEARHAYGLKPEECAVLFFNKPYDTQIRQLEAVADPEDWGVCRFIPYPDYWIPPGKGRTTWGKTKVLWSKLTSGYKFARTIDKFLKEECEKPLKLVATGNFLSRPHRHFLWAADKTHGVDEIMLLDEGTSVPNYIVPLRFNPNDKDKLKRFDGRFGRWDIAARILSVVCGFKFHIPESVTFFTVYKDIKPPKTDKVVVNNFDVLSKKLTGFDAKDEVWFIGTCYHEFDFVKAKDYFSLLAQVRSHFSGHNLRYFPHRYESDETLKKVQELGFEVTQADMSIETLIVTRGQMPRAFASITSSAVDNISFMFQGQFPITLFKPSTGFFTTMVGVNSCYGALHGNIKNGLGAVDVVELDFGNLLS